MQPRAPHQDLRSFITVLQEENELTIVNVEVDPYLEIAEIHRRVVEAKGKALLFTKVKGSSFPVVTNLFGTEKRLELAFPDKPEKIVKSAVDMLTASHPPKLSTLWKERSLFKRLFNLGTDKKRSGPVLAKKAAGLNELPILTCWIDDGGPFITLPLVYTEGSKTKKSSNLGMYRIQRFENRQAGLHFQIGKGGGFHYLEAEKQGLDLPVSITLGGPPALILAAIAPLPENVPEILLTSLLLGKKLKTVHVKEHPHQLIANAEFTILGHAKPHERRLEGPFGDHYGYYGLAHEFPVLHVETVYHRKDAIYPATVVGKPIQEDLYIGNYLQELFAPLISVVMPSVVELWSYPETGFHSLAAARIKERYEKESLTTAFRILGEGQLSLTKFLILIDEPVQLKDVRSVLELALSKCNFEQDFHIFGNTAADTLDYTGPRLNMGSKAVLIGTGKKKRDLPSSFIGTLPSPLKHAITFCKGVLVVDGATGDFDLSLLSQHESMQQWPLIALVDNALEATKSQLEFLWTVFTRFEPQSDIYPKNERLFRHQVSYTTPFVIDARMKERYPKLAECDEITRTLVDQRFKEYGIA